MSRYIIQTDDEFVLLSCTAADLDEYLLEMHEEDADGLLIDTEQRTFVDLRTVAAEVAQRAADEAAHIRAESMSEIFA